MTNNADSLRRWLGMFFLAVSFAMMMWGQIVLEPYLVGVAFTLYWVACFGLSITAVVFGVLDVRASIRNLRNERVALLRRAMRDIRHPKDRADGSLADK